MVDRRLAAAGVTPKQVQAIWMKQVFPQPKLPFPGEPKRLQAAIEDGLHTVHDRNHASASRGMWGRVL